MSQSAMPASNHSLAFLATSGCNLPSCVQALRNSTTFGSDSLKKKCSELRSSGRAPLSVEYGSIRSVGEYTLLHTSHESPYWSFAWQLGHSPLM